MTIVRSIVGVAFMLAGVLVFVTATLGYFKFDYVLNRMHACSMGDSLGLPLLCIGAAFLFWDGFALMKLILIAVFLYFTSPVSSHLIARVEMLTNRSLARHLASPGETRRDAEPESESDEGDEEAQS